MWSTALRAIFKQRSELQTTPGEGAVGGGRWGKIMASFHVRISQVWPVRRDLAALNRPVPAHCCLTDEQNQNATKCGEQESAKQCHSGISGAINFAFPGP